MQKWGLKQHIRAKKKPFKKNNNNEIMNQRVKKKREKIPHDKSKWRIKKRERGMKKRIPNGSVDKQRWVGPEKKVCILWDYEVKSEDNLIYILNWSGQCCPTSIFIGSKIYSNSLSYADTRFSFCLTHFSHSSLFIVKKNVQINF